MDRQAKINAASEHAFPMGFVMVPAFVGALLWLLTMLGQA